MARELGFNCKVTIMCDSLTLEEKESIAGEVSEDLKRRVYAALFSKEAVVLETEARNVGDDS